jgi:gamma-glutamyltranspeptidase/glutathione hydrolase
MELRDAVDAPRVHWDDGVVQVEGGAGADDGRALDFERVNRWAGRNLYFGGVSAVEVLADGSLAAAGDPRRGGAALVVG